MTWATTVEPRVELIEASGRVLRGLPNLVRVGRALDAGSMPTMWNDSTVILQPVCVSCTAPAQSTPTCAVHASGLHADTESAPPALQDIGVIRRQPQRKRTVNG